MLVGFDFGAAPKQFGVLAAAGVAAARDVDARRRNLITGIGRAFTSSKVRHEVHKHRRHHRDRPRSGRRGRRLRAGDPRLHLAHPGGGQPVPVPAARRRSRRCGRWPRRCAGGAISVAAMWRFSSVGIVLLAVPRSSTASATTSAVWAADVPLGPRVRCPRRSLRPHSGGLRRRSSRRAHADPALDERPEALGQRRAEQRLASRRGAAARSPPTRPPRPAASRACAAPPGSQCANGSSEWGSSGNE